MIMEEWKEYELSELIDEISMGPFGSNIKVECFTNSGVPVLNGSNLVGLKLNEDKFNYVTEEKAASLGKANAYRNDIVITHRGTLGQIVYIPQNSKYDHYVISQSQFRVRCNQKVLPEYLVYYFHTRIGQHQLLSNASQVGVPALARPTTTFQKQRVVLPTLPTQQKIAAILSSLDDKIELNNKINTNLERQAGALFKNWFVDDDTELIETEIGKMDILITDYVANGSFKDLADNVKYLSNETENVLIRLTDYNNNFSSDMVYISDESYNFLEKSKLFGDEIIISNVGANVGTVFRCPRLNKKMSLAPNSIMIRGGIYEHYLYLYFTSTYGQGLLKSIVTGSAQPKFNKTNFRSLKIKIPREEKLKEFNLIYDSLYEKMINNQKENLHLASLRNTLLPKLMNREIEV